ncbi:MAG TPA: hypothetical protein VNT55_00610, partial [Baekduia sp.]|nr:hypothetical protein [Baekduia sp.]
MRSAAPGPATTFVMCGPRGAYSEADVFATSDDGRTLRRLTTHAAPSGMTAARGVAVFTHANNEGLNGITKLTGPPTAIATREVPVAETMSGIPRLSRDGRKLAYVM